jgi:hypothetical protein
MPLLIVEGPRKAGKSHLVSNQTVCPVFKFDFNKNFSMWNMGRESKETHFWGLGKEVMLHELNKGGYLRDNWLLVDRGILTNSVWGVFQKRISKQQAIGDLTKFSDLGLLENTRFLLIEGKWEEQRKKDIWDVDDTRGEEERLLFSSFSQTLLDLNVPVDTFHNQFNEDSLKSFISLLKNITN